MDDTERIEHVGELHLDPEDAESVGAIWQRFKERLDILRAVNMGEDEVAGAFEPEPKKAKGS